MTKSQKIVEEEVPSTSTKADGMRHWKAHWTDQEGEMNRENGGTCEGIACDDLETWIAANKVTDQQAEALRKVRERWDMMETPQMDTINDCVMVAVGAGTNPMWLGIEKDGYTHS